MKTCAAIRELLSAYLDGELPQQEAQQVSVHLRRCTECREIMEDFRRMQAQIRDLPQAEPDREQWGNLMNRATMRTSRGLGWILGVGGVALLAGYGLYSFTRDPSVDTLERIGVWAMLGGGVLLFATVLVERLRAHRSDRYKDIEQ